MRVRRRKNGFTIDRILSWTTRKAQDQEENEVPAGSGTTHRAGGQQQQREEEQQRIEQEQEQGKQGEAAAAGQVKPLTPIPLLAFTERIVMDTTLTMRSTLSRWAGVNRQGFTPLAGNLL